MIRRNTTTEKTIDAVILICANAEWDAVMEYYNQPPCQLSPFGNYFNRTLAGKDVVLFHGGWGKVAAAGATQYIIDTLFPNLIINVGTCGGLEGCIKKGDILLANETLIYDIYERMGDPVQAIRDYTVQLDLSFLSEPFPQKITLGKLVSADQDIDPNLVSILVEEFSAVAADWESGAISWVARRNSTNLLILRAVSDMVSPMGGEIYSSPEFSGRAAEVMHPLLKALPNWLRCASWGKS